MLPLLPIMLAAATLDQFKAALNAQDSATAALTQWCGQRGIATPAAIKAQLVMGDDALPAPDLGETLGTDEPGYRHVQLSCGATVLSNAHNWYNPTVLTPEMRRILDTTDTPFGRAVAALNFRRETLASIQGPVAGCPADTVLANRALLRLPDGRVLALVVECYTAANLR